MGRLWERESGGRQEGWLKYTMVKREMEVSGERKGVG